MKTPEIAEQPSGGDRGSGSGSGPSIQASHSQPSPQMLATPAVAQMVAPERFVVIPTSVQEPVPEPEPIVPPEPEPIVPPEPEPIVPPEPEPLVPPIPLVVEPRLAPPTGLGALQQQLVELRKQLEGFQIDGLQLDPPTNGANGASGSHRDEGAAERG